ncbi:MAG: carbohydrate ABC transporter permease [Jiangellaceae bacterium]
MTVLPRPEVPSTTEPEVLRVAEVGPPLRQRSPSAPGRFTPYLFLAPFGVLFVTFVLGPAIYGIWISLHEWDFLLPNKPFIGFDNYVALFDSSSTVFSDFWQSMRATAIFTVASVPFLVVIPLGVALILNRPFKGRNLFRAVYLAPFVLGIAVVGVLWRFLLDSNIGFVNYYLGKLGLPDDIAWLTATPWAWISLVALTVWWTMGFNAIIYLAGLQDVPRQLYEAAKIDGASRWQEFWYVTLPQLRPVLLFVVTITILASANMFGQSFLVTFGAPANETRTAIMYIADQGLARFRMGSAASMSYLLAVTLAVIAVLNFRLLRHRD